MVKTMDIDLESANRELNMAFFNQNKFYELQQKVKDRQKNVKIDKMIEELVNIYSFDFEELRILKSLLVGMKRSEIERLYMGQRVVDREGIPTKEGFDKIINGLIEKGWVYRDGTDIKIDYDFFDCLGEVDNEYRS